MSEELDYENPHYCPVYQRTISIDLCFDSLMALGRDVKVSSVDELAEVADIEAARKICAECPYSEL